MGIEEEQHNSLQLFLMAHNAGKHVSVTSELVSSSSDRKRLEFTFSIY